MFQGFTASVTLAYVAPQVDGSFATALAFTAYRGVFAMVPDGSYRGVVEFFHVGPLGPVPAFR
ncbi:MAG TPA: hypothetical protein DD397_06805 [Hyphomonas sp.]|uniref:hypothetical protein n=1 Tax=Hyphomonas sp. TaxID=87 RepID=UPI000E7F508B|nr:hypothetical protein [Hyphomonas sp.]HBN92255.1 hypothetical protein [Hyphomonas sp.]